MEAGLADRAFDGAHVLRVVAGTSDRICIESYIYVTAADRTQDRNSFGNSRVLGLKHDLRMTKSDYSICANMFSGYLL